MNSFAVSLNAPLKVYKVKAYAVNMIFNQVFFRKKNYNLEKSLSLVRLQQQKLNNF